jgi:endonuclease/exonuclease/phosphatase family metal-dependent hydrolase
MNDTTTSILKVLTMNLWNFVEPYAARQRLMRAEIIDLNPDLMVFTEAGLDDRGHQVAELLDGLGYHLLHQFEGHEPPPFDMGLCLAARWEMALVVSSDLNNLNFARNYPSGALAAHVDCPEPFGKVLLIGAKPIWEATKEYEREHASIELAKMAGKHKTAFPTILAGDFDAAPENASIRFLTGRQSLMGESAYFMDAWEKAGDGSPGHTWPSDNATAQREFKRLVLEKDFGRRIDYIFLGNDFDHPDKFAFVKSCRVVMNRPVDGVWPSDHCGVFAVIEMNL